jgi:hypothetical protein
VPNSSAPNSPSVAPTSAPAATAVPTTPPPTVGPVANPVPESPTPSVIVTEPPSKTPVLTTSAANILNNSSITLTATGCLFGSTVHFFGTSNDPTHCKEAECKPSPITATNDPTQFTHTYSLNADYTPTTFSYYATCSTNGEHSNTVTFTVRSEGQEGVDFNPPSPIPADAPFDINLYGMEKNQCYFFKILDVNNQKFLEPEGGRILTGTCAEGKIDTGKHIAFSGTRQDHKDEFYYVIDSNSLSFTYTVPGLPDGAYDFQLYTADRGNDLTGSNDADVDEDNLKIDSNFLVGTGVVEHQYPPPPPCSKMVFYDEKTGAEEVDASGNPVVRTFDETFGTNSTQETSDTFKHRTFRCVETFSALGPFSTDPGGFVRSVLGFLLSISGGIALLLIIRSGYQMTTSSGNPEVIQEARDRITSAIVGLLFIILSLIILQVIGVDIFQLPGFGS